MDEELLDRLLICELIQNWAIWRDSGDWERFATVWHDDGVMCSTWKQASAAEFIQGCRDGWDKGLNVVHTLGGTSVEIRADRAIAQTRMTITQRATLDGHLVDVTCHGRFYDFLERRSGRWSMALRQPIYDRDRLDSVVPGARLELDPAILDRCPQGYRHLAYLQTKLGFTVKADMPGTRGPVVEALYARGTAWLDRSLAAAIPI